MRTTAALVTVLTLVVTPALAHGHKHHHRHYVHHSRHSVHLAEIGVQAQRPSDCRGIPWCGCFMRHLLGVSSSAFNLAREWAHYGHATVAKIGAIVVWPHHVGKIVGGSPGHWEILSGNDGHAVRTRVRSTAGAIAFRE